jgi:hypothetical protein
LAPAGALAVFPGAANKHRGGALDMERKFWFLIALFVVLSLAGPVAAQVAAFPSIIPLPDGFQPEGIVTGRGARLYAGSLANGAIYQADLRTGEGSILFPGAEGRVAVGLGFDKRSNYIFAAGGGTGNAYVYDGATGDTVGIFDLTDATPTFINDVIVTRQAAYFTDSSQPVYYRLPLLPGGALPDPSAVEEIPLSGDYEFVPGEFNANGIEATAGGRFLIIVNSTLGTLYLVEATSGEASLIDLGDDNVQSGDGLLLQGRTLYVVQNFLNQVAVVRLSHDLLSGEVANLLTNANFDIPTTIAGFGSSLYVVNACFSTPPAPETEYDVVKVR